MKKKLPTPQLLPSGMYRCQITVDGERKSVVDADPDICQAKAVALKSRMIEEQKNPQPITIEKAMEKYIEIRSNVLSPATVRAYKNVSITKAKVPDENNQYVTKKTTKTEKSRRVLNCPDYILNRLRDIQPDENKRTGQIVKMHPNDIYNHLKVICDNNGILFVGVHGLRHTNASVMLSLGVADKIAMARGGWSSKDTKQNIYQHLFSDDKSAADAAINGYFDALMPKP